MILDVATLTGHMVLALGDRVGGVIGAEDVVDDVLAAGEHAPARRSGRCRSPRHR